MPSKLTPKLIGQYIAALILLITGWATPVITAANTWGDVLTAKHTLALALAFIIWIGGCAAHFLATGDPAPITPAAERVDLTPILGEINRQAGMITRLQASLIDIQAQLSKPAEPPAPPLIVPSSAG